MSIGLNKCVTYVGGEPVVTFEKGDVAGHEFHGNQYTDGATNPVSVGKEKDAPAFAHNFLRENNTGAKAKAALKERSTDKLKTALRLLAGHEDTATNTLRGYINDELKSR